MTHVQLRMRFNAKHYRQMDAAEAARWNHFSYHLTVQARQAAYSEDPAATLV